MDAVPIPQRHQFDKEKLRQYLADNLPGFRSSAQGFNVNHFKFGQSNPTFHLLTDSGGQYVLRKQPSGDLLPGAHRVDREYRIITALHKEQFPVPCPLLFCSDVSVIGTQFYVMEYVQGRIFRDPSLVQVPAGERDLLYQNLVQTLARLHTIDWRKAGLEGYGGRNNKITYCQRQISVWDNNYKMACIEGQPLEEMEELNKWLSENLPSQPHPQTIIHGDYRMENVIFHPTEPRVIAVLDWELSSLGHPFADLAHLCMIFLPIPTQFTVAGIPGIPSEDSLMKTYCRTAGVPYPVNNWSFFKALTCFRMAAIIQGVYARGLLGNASSEEARNYKHYVQPLAKVGCLFTDSGSFQLPSLPEYLDFIQYSDKARKTLLHLKMFMNEYIYPAEEECYKHISNPETMWEVPPILEDLKEKARLSGLWNLFLPGVSGFTQLEYAPMAEQMGRSPLASEVFNCSAPDTGNMEVLYLYGDDYQKKQWLQPLLEGKIRSCFSMTEPDVASSDATNIECSIRRVRNEYEVHGRKWWSSGAGDPRCKVAIVMGVTDPNADRLHRHSMILVPLGTPGVKVIRPLTVFGYLDAPHGHMEIDFNHVRVPAANLILGEGRGFEIAQGRLGPGRIHHCMRTIGVAERTLEMMCKRGFNRKAFGKRLLHQQTVRMDIAQCRMDIDQSRLLVLRTAHAIDSVGSKAARKEIAAIKVVVANMGCRVVDKAIQLFGGQGVSGDVPLAHWYAMVRSLRIADGPDVVHMETVAKEELKEKAKL